MVREIFLRQSQVLGHADAFSGLEVQESIHQIKAHGLSSIPYVYLSERTFGQSLIKKGSISTAPGAGNPESLTHLPEQLACFSFQQKATLTLSLAKSCVNYFQIDNVFAILNKWEIWID